MHIQIELGDEVSSAAEKLIRQAVAACERQEIDFQAATLSVARGDYTCISKGEGHEDAARLFALVQRLSADPEPFTVDHEGYTLIPLSGGGFEKSRSV